jgi:ABC-type transport system involved in cytochrome c biogenesis permease component
MRKLIWKEWHEQSWKLAFGCIVLSAFVVIGMHARIVPDMAIVAYICAIGVLILPITSAAGLFPAERADGSFDSLIAMPIAVWKILLARTLSAVVLTAGPLAVAAAVTVLMAGGRESTIRETLAVYGVSALASTTLVIWMMSLTIRLPNEGRASLVSMGVLVIWGLITWPMYSPEYHTEARAIAFTRAISLTPFGWFFTGSDSMGSGNTLVLTGLVQGALLLAVWCFACRVLASSAEVRS